MVCLCGVAVICQDHSDMQNDGHACGSVASKDALLRLVATRGDRLLVRRQLGAACHTFVVTPAPGTRGRGVLVGAIRGCGWEHVRAAILAGPEETAAFSFVPASGGRTLNYIFCCSQG